MALGFVSVRETIPFTRTMGPMRVLVVVYWRLDGDGLGHRKRLASSQNCLLKSLLFLKNEFSILCVCVFLSRENKKIRFQGG
jgi:hypothetical protein